MTVTAGRFTEPDEFASTLLPSRLEAMCAGRGRFELDSVSVKLPRIRLRRVAASLPLLWHVQHPQDSTYLALLPQGAYSRVVANGMSVDANEVLHFGQTKDSHLHSLGPLSWANIAVESTELEELSRHVAERDLAPKHAHVVMPGKPAICRLRALHSEMIALATNHPGLLVEPEVIRGMEEQLMESIAACLSDPERRLPTSAQSRHATVMRRFRELLEANLDRTLYLPEVCATLGVSHRTLSYSCQEFLGMSPKRYFYLRRMHLTRRALREAQQSATTVTEIATRHGFWEFGRFSTHYKALFGETPSVTLRKKHKNDTYARSWIGFPTSGAICAAGTGGCT